MMKNMNNLDHGDEEELYPEILAQGSLAGALNHELRRMNLRGDFVDGASHASIQCRESQMTVILGSKRRVFILSYARNGIWLAEGATPSISNAASSANAWLSGVSLRDLGAAWEFVRFTEIQEAYEKGEQVATQWGILIKDAPDWLREILELARRNPRLASLYPVAGHNFLRFQEHHGDAIFEIPSIAMVSKGVFRIYYRDEEQDPWDGDAASILQGLVSWLESRG